MELQEFVQSALADIVVGVKGANDTLVGQHGLKAKAFTLVPGWKTKSIENCTVEFDVAVTTKESTTTEGGAKARIWIFEGGVGGEAVTHREAVSRIRFRITVREEIF